MLLPLPAQSSGAGNSQSAESESNRFETAKPATTKSETVLVPVAPLD
jgi:hypothetical protein